MGYMRSSGFKQRLPEPQDYEMAKTALARMEAELEAEGKELSDYEHNLLVVIRSGMVSYKTAGIAASLIPAYTRVLGEEIRRQRAAKSEHVGTVGKREMFLDLALERVIDVDTQFGTLHIHKFVDKSGNSLVWKTNSTRLDEGKSYNVKGTVKEHGDYKGWKQTELSRCKAEEIKEEK